MDFFQFFSLISVLCGFSIAKIASQRRCAHLCVRTTVDTLRMIAFFFFFTSLVFLPMLFFSPFSSGVLLYAIPAAILHLAFQVFYTLALASGPAGLTVLLSNLSMLIPMLGATFFLGEPFGLFRIIGLGLTLVALFLNTDFGDRKKEGTHLTRTYAIWMVLTFFSNGLATFWSKVFAKSPYGTEVAAYGFFNYALAAVLAVFLLLVLSKRNFRPSAPVSRTLVGMTALTGAFLGAFQWFFTYSQRVLDASLLLPVYNGATTVLMMLVGVLFYKETLTRRRFASAIVGVAAIVLFGISR